MWKVIESYFTNLNYIKSAVHYISLSTLEGDRETYSYCKSSETINILSHL